MRIIRGIYKGHRLTAPKAIKARPTTDFAKEGLFNILDNKIDIIDATVLDLFTGTGNLSFEFTSRGAKSSIAVDISHISVRFVNEQAKKWNLPIKAFKNNVFKFLAKPVGTFDIIFADPPYALDGIDTIPGLVLQSTLLSSDGLLIVEHGKETDFKDHPNLVDVRNYSKVNFSFFKHPVE